MGLLTRSECFVLRFQISRNGFIASFPRTVAQMTHWGRGNWCQGIVGNQILNSCPCTYEWMQTFSSVCWQFSPPFVHLGDRSVGLRWMNPQLLHHKTPSIQDFLTPKLNKVPCLLFILKFKSVGLLNLKNHGTWVLKQALTPLQCETAKKQYSVLLDLRIKYRLSWSSISVENFSSYFLADWSLTFATQMLFRSVLRTEDALPIVVIDLQAIFMTSHKQRYSLSWMLKDFHVWKFPIIYEYFHV